MSLFLEARYEAIARRDEILTVALTNKVDDVYLKAYAQLAHSEQEPAAGRSVIPPPGKPADPQLASPSQL